MRRRVTRRSRKSPSPESEPGRDWRPVAWRALQQFVTIAIGHHRQDLHGAVPLFNGNAELHALYQAFEPLRVVALFGADHAFGNHAAVVGEGQHDAAVQALDAQVDPVFWGERVGDQLKRIVHGALPPDKNMH